MLAEDVVAVEEDEDEEDEEEEDDDEDEDPLAATAWVILVLVRPLKAAAAVFPFTEALRAAKAVPSGPASAAACDKGLAWYD